MIAKLFDPNITNEDKINFFVRLYGKLGLKFFAKGYYNLNIFGIRTNDPTVNVFNDFIGVMYWMKEYEKPVAKFFIWPATTDPGLYYLNNPANVKGTAILTEGQYLGVYAIDKHRGKYDALCQRLGPVTVYRDRNKDDVHDYVGSDSGFHGINIHKAHNWYLRMKIGKYSAGCQVFQSAHEFNQFMNIVKYTVFVAERRNKFSYTLLKEDWLSKVQFGKPS